MNTVTDHLDQIIDAPDGIKRLRELILQLAVQGKLVEQRPEEGTADELLQQIAEAKRRDAETRRKNGERVRKTKPLPIIGKEEIPFEIPKGWEWVRLGNLSEVNGGFAFKSSRYTAEGIRVIRISDFDERGFKDNKVVRYTYSEDLTGFKLEPENILMAMTGGTVGKSLLVKVLPEPMVVNQRVATIKVLSGIIPEYVNSLIQTNLVQSVIHTAKNSTNDNISMGDIVSFMVPLPPLAEQKRIVAKVDELMAWCDSLDALKQKRDTLQRDALKATLHELTAATPQKLWSAQARLRFKTSEATTVEQPEPWRVARCATGSQGLQPSSPVPDILKRRLAAALQMVASPADVKQLRDAILQLAVQGRLVPQRDSDGTADDLLQQIEEAKRRDAEMRRKNGERIRKTKPLPPITPADFPYEIPENWEWVKIGKTMNMINGKAFKPTDWTPTGLPIVRIQNLNKPDAPFNLYDGDIDPKVKITSGEFLISWSGTPGTSFGAFIWERGDAVLNQHIFKCELWCGAYLKSYMKLAINSRLDEMISHAHGAVGLRHITKGKLENMCITLPPLAEQQRIVAKVDELMGWCDELETLLQTESETAARVAAAIAQTGGAAASPPGR